MNISASRLPAVFLKRTPDYWYTIRDGNWNDPGVWASTGRRKRNTFPSGNDSAMITHSVTVNLSTSVNNIACTEKGSIIYDSTVRTLTVNNSCLIYGTLNMSGAGSTAHNLILCGTYNSIIDSNLTTGTGSIITYGRTGNQDVLNLSYRNISVSGSGDKTLVADLTVNNVTSSGTAYLNLSTYNTTINGTFIPGASSSGIKKTSATGNTVFVGTAGNTATGQTFIFQNYPTIEFRGGLNTSFQSATGFILDAHFDFTTNNQNWTISNPHSTNVSGLVTVKNGLTLNLNQSGGGGIVNLSGGLFIESGAKIINNLTTSSGTSSTYSAAFNGQDGTSIFDNRGNVNYTSTADVMSTGLFYTNQAANTFVYGSTSNRNVRVPDDGAYRTLLLGPSGSTSVSTLTGNITCDSFELQSSGVTIAFGSYTITVNTQVRYTGASRNIYSTSQIIPVSGCGLFIQGGTLTLVENISYSNLTVSTGGAFAFAGYTVTISGSIFYTSATSLTIPTTTNLIHTADLYIRTTAALTLAGNRTCANLILDTVDSNITFAGFTLTSTTTQYIANASQKVWGTANQPLTNLTLGGTATPNNKTLQGNVSVPTTYSVTGNAVRVDNGFTFGNP